MNLFLIGEPATGGPGADRAAEVLDSLREPFLADGVLERWSSPAGRVAGAWLCHPPERLGGVRHAVADGGRLALFAGRPIAWEGERADGRGPLDPAFYLGSGWEERMDGRFAAVVAGDEAGLRVTTDALGAYPVYRCGGWVSNWPEALRRLCGGNDELDRAALAGVLGGGWSLDGRPLWAGIERVPWSGRRRGAPGAGFDPARAARLLVEGTRALADWPGRPNVVLVTGGRDSRLILAAALRAGITFQARTGGTPDMPDVVIGRELAAPRASSTACSTPTPTATSSPTGRRWPARWRAAPGEPRRWPTPPVSRWGRTRRRRRRCRCGTPGRAGRSPAATTERPTVTACCARSSVAGRAGRVSCRPRASGWSASASTPGRGTARRPARTSATSSTCTAAWRRGRRPPTRRSSRSATRPRRCGASACSTTCSACPAGARAREEFHLRVLEQLAPELVDLPFEGGRPWPARQSALSRRTRRVRTLVAKVAAEGRRRWAARGAGVGGRSSPPGTDDGPRMAGDGAAGADLFARALGEIRAVVLDQPGHAAWEVLDRRRVEELLARPATALDAMSRAYVLRLASVFAGFPAGTGGAGLPAGPDAQ